MFADELCVSMVVDPCFKSITFVLLATAVMVDMCVVMRCEGKGTEQIDRQCMVHTACP